MWTRKSIQVFKRGSNPWMFVWQPILLFFYTFVLVVVILNFWWMANGAYEAGHCLHGHHKFGEFHCTSLWEVYSCTIYQRLAFENMFGGEVYFTRPRKKEKFEIQFIFCTSGEGSGQEGLCIFFLLMVICF